LQFSSEKIKDEITFYHSHGYEPPKRLKARRMKKRKEMQHAQVQHEREVFEKDAIGELLRNFPYRQSTIEEIAIIGTRYNF